MVVVEAEGVEVVIAASQPSNLCLAVLQAVHHFSKGNLLGQIRIHAPAV